MIMLGEDIPKQLKANGTLQCYPGMEESDDEDLDAMAESYDIQMGTQQNIYFYFLYKNKILILVEMKYIMYYGFCPIIF